MHIINSTSPEFEVPPELTTHLLCGILIDTIGLKDGGKAVQADHYAAAYLIRHSSLALSGAVEFSTVISGQLDTAGQVGYLALKATNNSILNLECKSCCKKSGYLAVRTSSEIYVHFRACAASQTSVSNTLITMFYGV